MKKKSIITIMLALIAIMSCTNQNTLLAEVYLEGQPVKIDANKGLWPKWTLGDRVYALDQEWNICAGMLTKSEWQKAEKVLVQGQGQNQFGIVELSQTDDGALYVINHPSDGMSAQASMAAVFKIQPSTIKDTTRWQKFDLSKLSDFWQMGGFVVMSDSTILTTGAPANDLHHVLGVVNYKRQTVTPLDYWPNDSTPENLTEDKWSVYTDGSGLATNGKGRYLYWNDGGKLSFIFTIDGAKVNIKHYLYDEPLPLPSLGRRSMDRINCCANHDRIYLLYNDLTRKGEKMEGLDIKDPFPWGNTVEVYDWDGNKLQTIHLDQLGKEIMLSADGKTLYLYSDFIDDATDPYIYSYDLTAPSAAPRTPKASEQPAAATTQHVLEAGEQAVDAELFDLQGNKHHLFEAFADGKYVLIDFWSINCGACRKAEPELREAYELCKGKLEIVGINADSLSAWQHHDWNKHIAWTNWNDGQLGLGPIHKSYCEARAWPQFILLSPDKRIVWKIAGYKPGSFIEMANAINKNGLLL